MNSLIEAQALMVLALSFVVGSIPFGLVFTAGSGVDIRKVGSGNTGATNVMRAVGKRAAILTLLGDTLKGVAAVALARMLGLPELVQGAAGLASVLGHDFSIFMRFRGGKGVATSLGVVLAYMPMVGIITCVLWLVTVFVSRISSMGALVSFVVLPAVVWFIYGSSEKLLFSAIISILLVYKHKSNIMNLMKGAEGKIGQKA